MISWTALPLSLLLSSCANLPRHSLSTERRGNSSVLASNEVPPASRVNLNTASNDELEKLPGIGKVMAERIVAHRVRYGPFRRTEYLMMVQGISDHKLRAIRDLVTVE